MTILGSPSIDGGSAHRLRLPDTTPTVPTHQAAPAATGSYRPEPSYHPDVAPAGGSPGTGGGAQCAGGPYALPPGQTLSQTAGGTRSQPFDVTLSQLATAVYGTRGDPPPGWTAVTDEMIAERLGTPGEPATQAQVTAWRETYLAGGDELVEQEFKAEIYADCDGNFVLAYRGTAEGAADWENNFRQGTGLETNGAVDKYSGLAARTATAFEQLFGDAEPGQPSTNLAITGHSQGGALAAVGALVTDIPAVTFDAAGVHPNTVARLDMTMAQARDFADNGGIRNISLDSDALTQVQESLPTAPFAPDALGTQIVVSPGPVAEHTLSGRVADVEWDFPAPVDWAINTGVEWARHSGIPLVDTVGDVAYAALSHNPNVLTDAMIEQQPWQDGYQNPYDAGTALNDLIPDALKDQFAVNASDAAVSIEEVVQTDWAEGDYVQAGARILGDVGEGLWVSGGDAVSYGADALADKVDDAVPGVVGDTLATVVSGAGDGIEWLADTAGAVTEGVLDGIGAGAQALFDRWF